MLLPLSAISLRNMISKSVCVLWSCILVAVMSSEHHCIHDHLIDALPQETFARTRSRQLYQDEDDVRNNTRRVQSSTYQRIRITADTSRLAANAEPQFACYTAGQQYQPTQATRSTDRATCQAADVLTTAQRDYLISTIIPAAINFFSDMLSVIPVSGNLLLPNPIPDSYCCWDAANYCSSFVCCDQHFPQADRTTGVANTDFRIYVTARPAGGSTIAWALTCQSDQNARPLAGHINFNPSRVSTNPADFASQLSTAVHELMHALGFSSSSFYYWRKPGTNNAESYSNIVWSGQERGNVVKKIITPNVVAAVKAHFDCYTWSSVVAGAELEDFGAAGTAGSHWEKRLFMNEVMTGTADPNSVYSALTFAAFADMGWYQVSTSQVQRLPWGNGKGCSFVQQKCMDWSSEYFCTVANQGGCTVDMRYRAQCNLMDSPFALPTQFQYFQTNPNRGGSNGYVDYCPVYWRLSNGDCTASTTVPLWFYGEQVGSSAKCFAGTYQRSSVMNSPTQHAGCLESSCTANNLIEIKLLQSGGGKLTVTCPLAGGNVDLSTVAGSEFIGMLTCPPATSMCTGNPCDANDCNGRGSCNPQDGTCTCQAGYYGTSPFDCENTRCPMGVAENGTSLECAGNAHCNPTLGRCEDEDGSPGCYLGWADGTNGTCSRRGCPFAPCASGTCECAGRGTCVAGTCQCDAGYIGNACGTTDCGVGINGLRCSGAANGTCDGGRGFCECHDGFDSSANPYFTVGASCMERIAGNRVMPVLYFNGEFDAARNVTATPYTGVIRAKEYTYFQFDVPSTQYAMFIRVQIVAEANLTNPSLAQDLDNDGWISPGERAFAYTNIGTSALTGIESRMVAVAGYATSGFPTASSNQFSITGTDTEQHEVTLGFLGQGSGQTAFTQTGTMLLGVLSPFDAFVSVKLERDGCASLNCTHGECSNGQCVCPRYNDASAVGRKYGWTGLLCDVPDCPGFPDCSGSRGTCLVNAADSMPYCECSGLYTGNACQNYNLPSGTRVFGVSSLGLTDRSGFFTVPYAVPDSNGNGTTVETVRVYNATFTGVVEVSRNATPVVLDPSALQSCCSMDPPYTVQVRVTYDESPLADPILLAKTNEYPTLSSYSNFDEGGWRSHSPVHEFVTTMNGFTMLFISLMNGRYAEDVLRYSMTVEVVASGKCPASLRGCSGHGTCGNGVCSCDLGYEGLRCETSVPVLQDQQTTVVSALAPSAWSYWLHPLANAPNATAEVTLTMTRTGSVRAWPILAAAFTTSRTPASLSRVTSELAMFDYESYKVSAATQRIVIRRTDPGSQRFLYIGLLNGATSQTNLHATVSLSVRTTPSISVCDNSMDEDPATPLNATCRYHFCNSHGSYITVNNQPSCQCDFGWNPLTYCGSPLFASFSQLAAAAQKISSLCSVCDLQDVVLDREGSLLLGVPQPLLKSTGLKLVVKPTESNSENSRRLVNRHTGSASFIDAGGRMRFLQTNGSSNSTNAGNPALLVSTTLPRSILDFLYVSSSQSTTESIDIDDPSPTGRYWVALYANTPGGFDLSASRLSFAVGREETPSFGHQLASWLLASTAGYVVLACAGVFFLCVCGGCCLQHCTYCYSRRSLEAAEKAAKEDHEADQKRLRLLKSVRSMQAAMMEEVEGSHTGRPTSLNRASKRFLNVALANSSATSPDDKHKQILTAAIRAASQRNLTLASDGGLSSRYLGAVELSGQRTLPRRPAQQPSFDAQMAQQFAAQQQQQGPMPSAPPQGASPAATSPQFAIPVPYGHPMANIPNPIHGTHARNPSAFPTGFPTMRPQVVLMDPQRIPVAPPPRQPSHSTGATPVGYPSVSSPAAAVPMGYAQAPSPAAAHRAGPVAYPSPAAMPRYAVAQPQNGPRQANL